MTYQQSVQQQSEVSPGQLVERLVQYDGPPDQFLLHLLAVQCRVGNADNGAILRIAQQSEQQGQAFEVLSVYPAIEEGATAPVWLSQAVELAPKVMSSKSPVSSPLRGTDEMYGVAARDFVMLLPIWARNNSVRGVAAFVVPNSGDAAESLKRLELTITLLSLYELRLTVQRRGADLKRLRQACEVLAAINDQRKYRAAAMALCNHIASAWNAERVSLGLHKGRYIKMQAMSHTEKFTRKMELVQSIESSMEESLDQDCEVLYPAPPDTPVVSCAARELSQRAGQSIILSLPLRIEGEPVGAMTVERPSDQPFTIEEVETLRVTANLCTARMVELEKRDRWFGAKIANTARDGLAFAVGPKHTWIKVTAIAFLGLILFATFVHGTYKVDAPFVMQATERRIVVAPFTGRIATVAVEPDDVVTAGMVLATLDTQELRDQLIEAKTKAIRAEQQAQKAVTSDDDQEREQADIYYKDAELANLQAKMYQDQIDRATIVSPIDGIVLTGDLKQLINSPVELGTELFQVAPRKYHAELKVPEENVADLIVGQEGELASLAEPGKYLPFVITRIEPSASVDDKENVYLVRAELDLTPEQLQRLKAGLTGIAKVDIDRRPYGSIWTRELINWIRMKLWL